MTLDELPATDDSEADCTVTIAIGLTGRPTAKFNLGTIVTLFLVGFPPPTVADFVVP